MTGTQMVQEIKAAGYREVKGLGRTTYYMAPSAGISYRVLNIGSEPMVWAGDDPFQNVDKLLRVA